MDIAVLTALIRFAAKAAFGRLFYVPFMADRCLLIEATAPVGPCGADSWGNPSIAAMKSAQRLWNGRAGLSGSYPGNNNLAVGEFGRAAGFAHGTCAHVQPDIKNPARRRGFRQLVD